MSDVFRHMAVGAISSSNEILNAAELELACSVRRVVWQRQDKETDLMRRKAPPQVTRLKGKHRLVTWTASVEEAVGRARHR